MAWRSKPDEAYQTLIVRFFNDGEGRLRARVVDPQRDRAWLVEAAALRALVFGSTPDATAVPGAADFGSGSGAETLGVEPANTPGGTDATPEG